MTALLNALRHDPALWLLVFVPAVFVGHALWPEAHTLLFGLSVLGIIPLAALLSRATESVAARATLSADCSTRRSATSPSWSSR